MANPPLIAHCAAHCATAAGQKSWLLLVLPLLLFRFLLPFLFVAASVLPPSLPPFPSFIEIFLRRSTNLLFKVACAGSCYWYIFVFFSLLLLHKQYFLLYTKVLLPSFLSVRFFQDFFFRFNWIWLLLAGGGASQTKNPWIWEAFFCCCRKSH